MEMSMHIMPSSRAVSVEQAVNARAAVLVKKIVAGRSVHGVLNCDRCQKPLVTSLGPSVAHLSTSHTLLSHSMV